MTVANNDIRLEIKEAGVKHWQVANKYGVHEGNFSRLLRQELPEAEKSKIKAIIAELKAGA